MSKRIKYETLLSAAEAARHLPGRPSPATAWRWRTTGVNGVKLEFIRVGRRWFTSVEAIQRFIDAQSQDATRSAGGSLDQMARLQEEGLLGD